MTTIPDPGPDSPPDPAPAIPEPNPNPDPAPIIPDPNPNEAPAPVIPEPDPATMLGSAARGRGAAG